MWSTLWSTLVECGSVGMQFKRMLSVCAIPPHLIRITLLFCLFFLETSEDQQCLVGSSVALRCERVLSLETTLNKFQPRSATRKLLALRFRGLGGRFCRHSPALIVLRGGSTGDSDFSSHHSEAAMDINIDRHASELSWAEISDIQGDDLWESKARMESLSFASQMPCDARNSTGGSTAESVSSVHRDTRACPGLPQQIMHWRMHAHPPPQPPSS